MDWQKLLDLTSAEPSLAESVAKKDDSKLVNWWNTVEDNITIPIPITRQRLLLAIALTPFRIAALPDQPKRDAWRDVLSIIMSLDSINLDLVKPIVGQAVSDGVLTQEESDGLFALSTRKGTRAEKEFGAGVIVTEEMFNRARTL